MQRAITIAFIVALAARLLAACSSQKEEATVQNTAFVYSDNTSSQVLTVPESAEAGLGRDDYRGKRLGVITGTIFDTLTEDVGSTPVYYSEDTAVIEDVKRGRIDGFMSDLSRLRVIAGEKGNEDLQCEEIPAELFTAPMGAVSLNQDIIDRFNAFISELKSDGTLSDMQERWLGNVPDLDSSMPDITLSGQNGTLRVAVCATKIPFVFIGSDGERKGYSAELAIRFAAREKMDIEFIDMDFSGLIPYVVSGKADFAISNISITEERKKSVLFTDSIFDDQGGVLMLKSGEYTHTEYTGFVGWLKTGIERNLITDNRWKMIVDGLSVTMVIAFAAQIIGTLFGFFVCFVLTRRSRFAQWTANLYCGLIKGTPVVVLLMISYYILFGAATISNVLVAIAAFAMVTGANVANVLKGAIETVDPVEIEAARSLGFSALGAFLTVTLPQAVRRALPAYTGGFVELVKATAIVGYIAISDLTRAGDIIRSRTYDAYFPILFVALIYLVITAMCVWLFKWIVKKVNGDAAV